LNLPIIGTSIFNISTCKVAMAVFLKKECFGISHTISSKTLNEYYHMAHLGGTSSKYAIASLKSELLNVNTKEHISNITEELLIIWGEENQMSPMKNYQMENQMQGHRFESFKGCNGLPHLQQSEKFNCMVSDFLE
jgi:hypothetical protein